MAAKNVSVVLAHGAWADGSSWARVIAALKSEGVNVVAAPLPLTSLADDVAALDRIARARRGAGGAGRACLCRRGHRRDQSKQVKALVYVTALAPDEGEKVADVFYRPRRIHWRRNSRPIATA